MPPQVNQNPPGGTPVQDIPVANVASLQEPAEPPADPEPPVNHEQPLPEFGKLSVALLNSLFDSIDGVVRKSDKSTLELDRQVADNASALADSLCDKDNAKALVKSYVNLNGLLKEYTKASRNSYIDHSEFSEDSDDRSITQTMTSGENQDQRKSLKHQAAVLNMIINGIYSNCLDLSGNSNENVKVYLTTLNTMLFGYAELSAIGQDAKAKDIKQKTLDVAAGAILTSQSSN